MKIELSDRKLQKLAFVLSQVTPDQIRGMYSNPNLPVKEAERGAIEAIAIRHLLIDLWKNQVRSSMEVIHVQ